MIRSVRSAVWLGVVVVVAGAGMGTAAGSPGALAKVEGGGQVAAADGIRGPGDTITFTAQQVAGDADAATGRVNLVDRSQGPGREVHFNGDVTCLVVVGKTATIAGTSTDVSRQPFTVVVMDAGESDTANDRVSITRPSAPSCQAGNDDRMTELVRGNAQVTAGDVPI